MPIDEVILSRLKSESGFGLIELLIAMVVPAGRAARPSSACSAPAPSRWRRRRTSTPLRCSPTSRWSCTARCPTTRSACSTYAARRRAATTSADTTVCQTGQATSCNDTSRGNSSHNTGSWSCTPHRLDERLAHARRRRQPVHHRSTNRPRRRRTAQVLPLDTYITSAAPTPASPAAHALGEVYGLRRRPPRQDANRRARRKRS